MTGAFLLHFCISAIYVVALIGVTTSMVIAITALIRQLTNPGQSWTYQKIDLLLEVSTFSLMVIWIATFASWLTFSAAPDFRPWRLDTTVMLVLTVSGIVTVIYFQRLQHRVNSERIFLAGMIQGIIFKSAIAFATVAICYLWLSLLPEIVLSKLFSEPVATSYFNTLVLLGVCAFIVFALLNCVSDGWINSRLNASTTERVQVAGGASKRVMGQVEVMKAYLPARDKKSIDPPYIAYLKSKRSGVHDE